MTRTYTVSELARLSGVSVRTLHHYDAIGLLKPAQVAANGYRLYGRQDLLRLQQILLHRELEFPLEAIKAVLDQPAFDRLATLRRQKAVLADRAARYAQLLETLEATLVDLEGETTLKDEDLFAGFSPEKQAEHQAFITERYGEETYDASKRKMRGLGKEGFAAFQAEMAAVEQQMAKALTDGLPIDSAPVTDLMRRHHALIAQSWPAPPTAEAFTGLGALYLEHPEFTARYEALAPGLTEYLAEAMRVFAEREL